MTLQYFLQGEESYKNKNGYIYTGYGMEELLDMAKAMITKYRMGAHKDLGLELVKTVIKFVNNYNGQSTEESFLRHILFQQTVKRLRTIEPVSYVENDHPIMELTESNYYDIDLLIDGLTEEQQLILAQLGGGKQLPTLAKELGISNATYKRKMKNIKDTIESRMY